MEKKKRWDFPVAGITCWFTTITLPAAEIFIFQRRINRTTSKSRSCSMNRSIQRGDRKLQHPLLQMETQFILQAHVPEEWAVRIFMCAGGCQTETGAPRKI